MTRIPSLTMLPRFGYRLPNKRMQIMRFAANKDEVTLTTKSPFIASAQRGLKALESGDTPTAITELRQANEQFDASHPALTVPGNNLAAPKQDNMIKAALLVPLAGALFQQAEKHLGTTDRQEAMSGYGKVFEVLNLAETHLGGPDQISGTLYGSGLGRLFDVQNALGITDYGFSSLPRDVLLPLYALRGLCHTRMHDHYPYRDIPVDETPWPAHLIGSQVTKTQETIADAGPGIGDSSPGTNAQMRREAQLCNAQGDLNTAIDFSLRTETEASDVASTRFSPAAAQAYLWFAALADRINRQYPLHSTDTTPATLLTSGLNRVNEYNRLLQHGKPIDTTPFNDALRLTQSGNPIGYLVDPSHTAGNLPFNNSGS